MPYRITVDPITFPPSLEDKTWEEDESKDPLLIEWVFDCRDGKYLEESITSEKLDRFFTTLNTKTQKTYEIKLIGNMGALPDKMITSMMNHLEFIDSLNDIEFKKFILSSNTAANIALNTPIAMERLNTFYPDQEVRQVFSGSCVARVLLKMKLEYNLIDKSQYTNHEEFKIYRNIWHTPGSPSTPENIVRYIKQLGLEFSVIEIPELTGTFTAKDIRYDTVYRLFKAASPDRIICPKSTLDESPFMSGDICILIVASSVNVSNPTHGIFVRYHVRDKVFQVIDPVGRKDTYKSISEFVDGHGSNFTGVGYVIKPRPRLELEMKPTVTA